MTPAERPWAVLFAAKALQAVTVACALYAQLNLEEFGHAYASWPPGGNPALSSRFSAWDVAHYLGLGEYGYQAGSHSCAFYPLWPAAIRVAAALTGGRPALAGMLLANALSIVGLWLVYRLVERHCGGEVSRDSLILMLAFPGALFFSFPYSESLYFVLVMLFFWGLELQRWAWIAAAAFLLPLARPTGVFVLAPLAWFLWKRRRPSWAEAMVAWQAKWGGVRRQRAPGTRVEPAAPLNAQLSGGSLRAIVAPAAVAADASPSPFPAKTGAKQGGQPRLACRRLAPWLLALCPLLGYAAYFGVMYAWTGNVFEGFAAQRAYPNSPSVANMFNVAGFVHALANVQTLDGMLDSGLDRAFFLLFLALLVPVYRLNKIWFFYVLPAGLVPALTSWFMSYRRYTMVLFPMFVALALLLGKAQRRWAFWCYVAVLAALQAWAIKQFMSFNWAG